MGSKTRSSPSCELELAKTQLASRSHVDGGHGATLGGALVGSLLLWPLSCMGSQAGSTAIRRLYKEDVDAVADIAIGSGGKGVKRTSGTARRRFSRDCRSY